MAEYLSPGVYVEEYDSGAVPMQGVSTSTAGFIGLAQRGPVVGKPQLVTSFADYKRAFGLLPLPSMIWYPIRWATRPSCACSASSWVCCSRSA